MSAALVTALAVNHDHDELADDLANLLKANEIARHGDLDLEASVDLIASSDTLELTVEGEEGRMLSFLSRCEEEAVRVHAVREDDESHFRLV